MKMMFLVFLTGTDVDGMKLRILENARKLLDQIF